MSKKIALIGLKGIGKDYLFNKFFTKYSSTKRFAVGDSIKIQSLENYPSWSFNGYLLYDYIYLKNAVLSNDLNICPLIREDNKTLLLNLGDYDSLSLPQKLSIVEIAKNIPTCKTRYAITNFGTYIRNITSNPIYFLEEVISQINQISNNYEYIFINDCRTIVELIEYILNDFFIIKLENISLLQNLLYKWGDLHGTEVELNTYPGKIGLNVSMEGSIELNGIKRKSDKEMLKLVDDISININGFGGYSQEDKLEIQNIKNQIFTDFDYNNLFFEYSNQLLNKKQNFETIKSNYYSNCLSYVNKITKVINKYY